MTLFCDGASRGNPGPAAYGYIIFQESEIVAQAGGKLGTTTNNVAEYQGLIQGLRKLVELGASEITVKADSQLMIQQLKGVYKVKTPHIKELFDLAQVELKHFSKKTFLHIPREENGLADALCNQALDGKI